MPAPVAAAPELLPGLRPYCTVAGATLYHADAVAHLDRLPAGRVAALLTDPPYSSGGLHKGDRIADPREKYCHNGDDVGRASFSGDNRDQRSWAFWCNLWLTQCRRTLRDGGYALIFSDWRQLPTLTDVIQSAGLTWRGLIAWNKGRGSRAPHKGYFRHQAEYLAWGTNGPCHIRTTDGPLDGVYTMPILRRDKHHMTGKPTPLLQELVRVTEPGELVLDPFNGSGTTGTACILSGREYVGFELSEAYCETTAKRWEAAARGELLPAA